MTKPQNSRQETNADALPENEALSLLKSLQGSTDVVVPLVINGKKLHSGIQFSISLNEYNAFLNASQSGKISPTAAAKNYLMGVVCKEHHDFLAEALKVKGVLNQMMIAVTDKVEPDFGQSLD
ncbi:putative phage tail assembly chaperone [Vibrio sp. V39_P1S14PM300]|uniref:putative phage tail assembly chaperone n=1 Tax=Vibrio sp. V39_P1S14PM300 TaxID=1938690 RepID=UPI0013724892|nr:putative phage tail assembly chaperone [Vibrio sp. V39_P1S14PM300]NAX21280.1 hypothetical protein [Vibrio sp. V39_P1S14PM300]